MHNGLKLFEENLERSPLEEIRIQGYLLKLSPSKLIGWQKRWFVLNKHKL